MLMHHANDQVAGKLIRQIRHESGLRQIELARRSRIPSSVLSAYEHGHRQPAVAALARIAGAAGLQVRLGRVGLASDEMQLIRAGKILAQVLDLAEQLPYRPRRRLAPPPPLPPPAPLGKGPLPPERLIAVHDPPGRAGPPHAVGGAIALGYCTL